MENRREFLRKAALLTGGTGLFNGVPASIQKAFAINPAPGTTYLDAEHIVFLMQENRSFDHCYGTLQGVRGFNDPRAIRLPNRNKVWAQTNKKGETYAPFRLELKESKITWLGSLPHSWDDMTAARNEGHYDNWLDAKQTGHKDCEGMPMTMGYFDRRDIPFYYALADAFTVCDHHFCSSLTGTTPNRLHFWTGTIREKHSPEVPANVYNSDVSYENEASWKTFPEYLEENKISWRIYQNEISLQTGFEGEEEDWLANFTNNPIEWFRQYRVRFSYGHRKYLAKAIDKLPVQIKEQKEKIANTAADSKDLPKLKKQLDRLEKAYAYAQKAIVEYSDENYNKLSQWDRNLHDKAFSDNRNDPDYRSLETIEYMDGDTKRTMQIPKGDLLHQFREDVNNGTLPTVSWVIAPCNFSDHPGAPWYGAWYLSEVMDILTKNPEVWKKTIFVLNYDENDGYFDHLPPFVPPNPYKPNSGKVSAGIDTKEEWVSREQGWMKTRDKDMLEGPIGLGYRVPMVIASPWSRGGFVNSEVFDLTSPIQFLEHFLSHKTGKKIECEQISSFRRAICGDLRSVFRPYNGENLPPLKPVDRIPFLESIHKAQFKDLPSGFRKLSSADIKAINEGKAGAELLPQQEKGTRPANPIPYQMHVEYSRQKAGLQVQFESRKDVFGAETAGVPYIAYTPHTGEAPRNYVVLPGDKLEDNFPLDAKGNYHLEVYGPNGFYRAFKGNAKDPELDSVLNYEQGASKNTLTGNLVLMLRNRSSKSLSITITDNSYKTGSISKTIAAGKVLSLPIDLSKSSQWYDLSIKNSNNASFETRYAGHVETGRPGITDPLMGGVV